MLPARISAVTVVVLYMLRMGSQSPFMAIRLSKADHRRSSGRWSGSREKLSKALGNDFRPRSPFIVVGRRNRALLVEEYKPK
jgi:hypothetical protein